MANIDVEMGQFPIKTTMANSDYVVINLADGSQGQIKVSDLASVVAGCLSFSELALTSENRIIDDFNSAPNGVSFTDESSINGAISESYGILFQVSTLSLGYRQYLQLWCSGLDDGYSFYIRIRYHGTWGNWKKLG